MERKEASRWRRSKLPGRKGESVTVESYETFQWKGRKLPSGKGGSFTT